jgi:Ca-activated chloride channel homolog
MRGVTLCLLLACVGNSTAAASSTWSNLWSTPEQQAQHLLDSRQAAAAAPLFKDPRRRGYAQLRAGQYAQAAKSLAPLHDADSLYNRGNALAHTGELRDALAAYDAALKQSPGNGDIVHNRDLVARALQKQQQSPKSQQGSKGAGSGQGGQQDNAGGQQGRTGGAGSQQAGGSQHQDRTGGQQAGGSQHQDRTGGQQAGGSQQQARAGGQQAGGGDQQARAGGQQASGGDQQARAGGQQAGGGEQQASAGTQQADAESGGAQRGTTGEQQGRSDEQQSGAHGQPEAGSNAGQDKARQQALADSRAGGKRSKGAPPPPRSEQSLALDQWLRGIPDDSGELLRRKFMIEHMMKQQEHAP